MMRFCVFFFFQAEDGIRDATVTGVQTCALPICRLYRTEVRQKWESASGGMVSTMSDFSKFAQMLANGGTLERSEERRVGKECRSRWSWYQLKKKRKKKEMEK